MSYFSLLETSIVTDSENFPFVFSNQFYSRALLKILFLSTFTSFPKHAALSLQRQNSLSIYLTLSQLKQNKS